MRALHDLWLLFFPSNCLLCGKRLPLSGQVLCFACEYELPRTRFGDDPCNPVNQIFWGRVPVESATSLLRFEKGSSCQLLLHELKYRGNRRVGNYLGKLLGESLTRTRGAACDLLVPVPIHRIRMRERGYNQSEVIASGVSDILKIPVETGLLERRVQSDTQTTLGRYERYENVTGNFRLRHMREEAMGTRILLIDDVVTTGATLEACSELLVKVLLCKVHIATVGFA